MLLLNGLVAYNDFVSHYFNTSYVVIKHKWVSMRLNIQLHFNTSYVVIKQTLIIVVILAITYFNTSYVVIKHAYQINVGSVK